MRTRSVLMVLLFLLASTPVLAADRSYSEGAVSVVTAVKIHDGQFDKYMDYLAKTYKPVLEAQKKAGLVLSFNVYTAQARSPNDPDLYLVVSYPNMATFDGLDDKSEAVSQSVTGENRDQANTAYIDRGKMRQILGTETIREMVLK